MFLHFFPLPENLQKISFFIEIFFHSGVSVLEEANRVELFFLPAVLWIFFAQTLLFSAPVDS